MYWRWEAPIYMWQYILSIRIRQLAGRWFKFLPWPISRCCPAIPVERSGRGIAAPTAFPFDHVSE